MQAVKAEHLLLIHAQVCASVRREREGELDASVERVLGR